MSTIYPIDYNRLTMHVAFMSRSSARQGWKATCSHEQVEKRTGEAAAKAGGRREKNLSIGEPVTATSKTIAHAIE
jgi:hypothetical protein